MSMKINEEGNIFSNIKFDEFTILESINIYSEYTVIDMPDGYSASIDARRDSHNSSGGAQSDSQHGSRIKINLEGNPDKGITFPVDFKRGGIRKDLIPTKLDKFKSATISKSFDVACAISAYAKDEIKAQTKFPNINNEEKLRKRLNKFNDLSDKEKEKYILKGRKMSENDTIGKSKI